MTGVLGNNILNALRLPLNTYIASGSRTNIPLNNSYTHGSAGPALAVRHQVRSADPINELYVMLETVTGTLGSITMGCGLYGEHASSASQPHATTLRATATAVTMPSAAIKWIKVTFGTPYTPTIGEILWFVLYNTSAAPTVNYPNILCGFNVSSAFTLAVAAHNSYSTVNGFSSAGTFQSRAPFVVVQGTKSYGWATTFLNTTMLASDATLRGFQITPKVDIEVSGWMSGLANTVMTGVRIYDAATPPAGSPLYTFPLGTDTNQNRDETIGAKIWAPIVLTGGVTYNVVTSWASAATIAGGIIEDYASYPAVFDDLVDGFVTCWTVQDVAGTWTLFKSGFINQSLIVSDFIAPAFRRPKVWNGTTWQEKPMGVWNGTAWEEQPLKVWDGSDWV